MKQAKFLAPGSLDRLLQKAEVARQAMDFRTCIDTLQEASRLAPANTGILLQLGRIHGLRYDYASAGRYFDQALRMAPQKTGMLASVAESCIDFRDTGVSESYLRRALEPADARPEPAIYLAALYLRLRKIPEAVQLVDRALAASPGHPNALLVRAQLGKECRPAGVSGANFAFGHDHAQCERRDPGSSLV